MKNKNNKRTLFTWKNILYFLISVALMFFLSNLGFIPIWIWNFFPFYLVFGGVLFWGTVIFWITDLFIRAKEK